MYEEGRSLTTDDLRIVIHELLRCGDDPDVIRELVEQYIRDYDNPAPYDDSKIPF